MQEQTTWVYSGSKGHSSSGHNEVMLGHNAWKSLRTQHTQLLLWALIITTCRMSYIIQLLVKHSLPKFSPQGESGRVQCPELLLQHRDAQDLTEAQRLIVLAWITSGPRKPIHKSWILNQKLHEDARTVHSTKTQYQKRPSYRGIHRWIVAIDLPKFLVTCLTLALAAALSICCKFGTGRRTCRILFDMSPQ